MRTNVEIENKLYNDIVSYCVVNALNPVKYIEKALRERLATDKYGDLNERLAKNTQREIDDVTPEAETHIVSKEPLTEEIHIQENHEVSKPNEFPESMDVLKKETAKKRQLKTR